MNIPVSLRTGRDQPGQAFAEAAAQHRQAARLVVGDRACPHSWRGLVRIAVVRLVSTEEPMGPSLLPLPETLALDAGMLDIFARQSIRVMCGDSSTDAAWLSFPNESEMHAFQE